jgi:hypothetical protein
MRVLAPTVLTALIALAPLALPAAEKPPAPALTLQAVRVDPPSPGPDTLCRLTVTVRNAGDRPASALELAVKVAGKPLAAYRDRVFLEAVEPGATREIRLLNFWSTEAGRPAPADGKLPVEVTLAKASWMQRETKDGATVWTPSGAVEGLPAAKSLTLSIAKVPR